VRVSAVDNSESVIPGLDATIAGLVDWFGHHGLAGFDPYDVYDRAVMKALRKLDGRRGARLWYIANNLAQRHPRGIRVLLGQRPHENSKSVGLLLGSWVRLNRTGVPAWPIDGLELVRWLQENKNTDYPGASWSYPWGYQSRIYFPAGTPWGIVTAICGEALLDYAEETGNDLAMQLAEDAAVFLAEALRIVRTETGAYLTYTPIDDFAIHNASISMGAYLARAGARFDRPEWAQLAMACLDYTLSEQCEDGAFDYWGAHQSTSRHVDNYHTGFVLRALHEYSQLGYSAADSPLSKGWAFYERAFVETSGRPLTLEGREIPIDIHACAESILCGAAISDRFPDGLAVANRAFRWTVENLRNADGSFGYGVFPDGTQTMAYTRWGEAWMLRALSELRAAVESAAHPPIA